MALNWDLKSFSKLPCKRSACAGPTLIDPATLPKVDTIMDKLQRQKEQEVLRGLCFQSGYNGYMWLYRVKGPNFLKGII